jgi:phosphatidylglycerol:prolipoprotein diacylglycerol transferase
VGRDERNPPPSLRTRRTLRVLGILVTALATGIVLARVFDLFVAWAYYAEDPSRIWALDFSGFSLYGGLLGAGLVGLALARHAGFDPWRLADATIPGVATGIVLMRVGCLLNGCCFGHETSLPWGLTYPAGSAAWVHQAKSGGIAALFGTVRPVHPTPVYEMIAAAVLAAFAMLIAKKTAEGVPFLSFALGFTLFRLANGFLRVRQPVITVPEWFYPVFYAVLAVVFAGYLVARVNAGRQRETL